MAKAIPKKGGATKPTAQPGTSPAIAAAIQRLEERISLYDRYFTDDSSAMAYRDALALAVEALKDQLNRGEL